MAKAQPTRQKRVPQRMCIACRQGEGKRQLVRLVRTPEGVKIDPTGKLAGRGAYLHPERQCWQQALAQRMIQRALRTQIGAEDLQALQTYADALPEPAGEEPASGAPPAKG